MAHKIKLCKDCFYFVKNDGYGYGREKCKRIPNLIDGTPKFCCEDERRWTGKCGEKGKYFKPNSKELDYKVSFFQKLFEVFKR